jgi:hypothetical protein
MDVIRTFDSTVDNFMSTFLRKPTLIRGAIHLILILYAARIAPKPPQVVLDLFENQYFKLFFFALILWTAQFSPSTSLLIAVAFMVTMNYFGQKALWEFMENVETTTPPTAPSKEVALETSAAIVENQMEQPPVVQSVTQGSETIVVQPTVIQTPDGPTVQTPTVVVAPAVVTNQQGETMLVKPDVTVVEVPQEAAATAAASAAPVVAPEQQSAVEAVSTLAAAAASEQPASPQVVAELAQTAVAAATTSEAKEAVDQLAQQAVKAEAAPAQEIKITAMTAIQDIAGQQPVQQPAPEAGCYPIRRYDMSQVTPFSFNDSYGSF